MTQQQITVKDAMNLKVMHLNLHIRISNCLRNRRIITLSELTKLDENSLIECRGIGKRSVAEIETSLKLLGLKLKMSQQDWEIWTKQHEELIKKLLLDEKIFMLNNLKYTVLFIENNSNEIIAINEYMDVSEYMDIPSDFTKAWIESVLARIKIPIVKDEKLWEVLHEGFPTYPLPDEVASKVTSKLKGFFITSYGENYEGKMKKLLEFRSQIIDIYINKEKEENK